VKEVKELAVTEDSFFLVDDAGVSGTQAEDKTVRQFSY
jgi:hypothetical protein